jgi:Protein trafficking PGA2
MLIGIDWLRLGIIVFGYLLLRPILIRQAARFQTNQLEKEDARLKKEAAEALKTNKATGKDDIQWGQGVKTRQRKNEERMIAAGEESDDDDLQDLLTR